MTSWRRWDGPNEIEMHTPSFMNPLDLKPNRRNIG